MYQDIGKWDVSNVTDMNFMFYNANAFNQDIGKWDVSNVTNMSWMFYDAESFDQDIDDWDISKVKHMTRMFTHGSALISYITNIPVFNVFKISFFDSLS
jgi:surface protein